MLKPRLGGVRDVASVVPLFLMNRLNKTEADVFIFWMLFFFQRIPISVNLEIATFVVVP